MSSVTAVSSAASLDPIASLTAQLQAREKSRIAQNSQDVYKGDTFTDSSYIGDLHPNQDRLNVFSTLDANEPETFYRFNLPTGSQVAFGMLVDQLNDAQKTIQSGVKDGVRIQLLAEMGNRQQVIADSNPDAGRAYQAYQQLSGGELNLRPAKYFLRAYRDPSQSGSTPYSYSFQLSAGRYSRDLDTITHTPPKTLGQPIVQQIQFAAHKNHTGTDPIVNLLVPGTTMGASTDPLANLLTPQDSFATVDAVTNLLGGTINLLA
jgi:hypothetical protein